MAKWVSKYENGKWYLQPFVARKKEEMIDEMFSEKLIPENMKRTPKEVLERMKELIKPYYYNCEVRE